jgi:hypothetical protein
MVISAPIFVADCLKAMVRSSVAFKILTSLSSSVVLPSSGRSAQGFECRRSAYG